jgi:hypothetical protein
VASVSSSAAASADSEGTTTAVMATRSRESQCPRLPRGFFAERAGAGNRNERRSSHVERTAKTEAVVDVEEQIRAGTGPKDNLVVLITSLVILAAAGAFLLWYFGFWPHL